MVNMCDIITPYRCKKCGQDMLFFVTSNNLLIDYKKLFNDLVSLQNIVHNLESRNIKYLKCLVCNKTFIIDWTNRFPCQLTDKECIEKFRV